MTLQRPVHEDGEPDDEAAGWEDLVTALVRADGDGGAEGIEWAMREARVLVLDGRATLPALVALTRRHAFGAWPTLRDCATGTAAHVLAVLRGWDEASVPGTGHEHADRPDAFPSAPVEVFAVWCAAAADRLGLDAGCTEEWARAGLFAPGNAPDPGWVGDPHEGPDADQATGPEDDEAFVELQRWVVLVGAA